MERRVLLAIFLSFIVLYAYQSLVVPVPKPPAARTTTTPGPASSGAAPPADAPPKTEPADQPSAPPSAAPVLADAGEREIRVETRDVIALFTNRGARLKSWRLKHYLDHRKEPLELVANELAATHPLPFSLRAKDTAVTDTLNRALYKATDAPGAAATGSTPSHLTFEYSDSAGIHAVKEFHLEPAGYVVAVRAAVTQNDQPVPVAVQWGPALADSGAGASSFIRQPGGLIFLNGKLERLASSDVAEKAVYDGDFKYAGVDDHYFMTAALNTGPTQISYQPVSIPPPVGSKDPARELMAYAIDVRTDAPLKFFVGPKDFGVLEAIDRPLVKAIDFGMFDIIVVPLLKALIWVNGYVGNYGWSIIFLTIIINAIMFPLRHKSVVSMRKMQELQPEVKAIQDRYSKLKATDPAKQKMNQELMALYKERGVNPASGCVPMLLTMPVLLAFYALLSVAIQLRGAPFFGWIHDLSQYDPLYITPILMALSQVWQQKLTPATGADPAQQKLMMFMPIIFTFIFLWAPAGVALYWFVSNLWTIGQQYLTNYLIGPPNIRTIRPAAERRVKPVGGGKTEAAARAPQGGQATGRSMRQLLRRAWDLIRQRHAPRAS